ncbi:hypothetical protein QJS66_05515 [Kocuria rhizophila]|nr:hypothetical protein QJS66_05515 [Kocuria rhizophila]
MFVPCPIGNGEQELNARSLVGSGGAQIVADDQFTPQFYRDTVAPLVSDAARLDRMAGASQRPTACATPPR